MNLFKDILPSLLQGHTPILQLPEDFEYYQSFQINRALSYHSDCIFFVNEMNKYHGLDSKMQHDFYFYGLRKYKRPFTGKWAKKHVIEDGTLNLVMEALKCSEAKAEDVLALMSDEDIENFTQEFSRGGEI